MKPVFQAIYLLVLLPALAAAEPQVRVWLEDTELRLGSRARLFVDLMGEEAADCCLGPLPDLAEVYLEQVDGPRITLQQNEGAPPAYRARFELELIPLRTGQLILPPLEIRAQGGKRFFGDPPVLNVRPAASWEGTRVLRFESDRTQYYFHQPMVVEITLELDPPLAEKLRHAPDREWLDLSFLDEDSGFERMPVPEDPESRRPLSQDRTARFRLLPIRAGALTLKPLRYYARLADGKEIFLESQPLNLEILSFDHLNRPPCATNGVGAFTVQFEASPLQLKTGESLVLSFEVAGDGNLGKLDLPTFPALDRQFQRSGVEQGGDHNQRWLRLHLSPRSGSVQEIPALAFAWFDPVQGDYDSVTWGPQPIQVLEGGPKIQGSPQIEPIITLWNRPVWTDWGLPLALVLLGASGWVLAWTLVSVHRKEAEVLRRSRALRTEAGQRFRWALQDEPEQLFRHFCAFIADRFQVPLPEVQAGVPGNCLVDRGVPEALALRVDRLCRQLERDRFDPRAAGLGSGVPRQEVLDLVELLEKGGEA